MNFGVILLCIFVPACLALLFYAIIYISAHRVSSQKVEKGIFTVSIPNLYAVVGGVTAMIFGIFILFSPIIWPNEPNSFIIFYVVFGAFFWLGIYLVIKTIRFRIVMEESKITAYPLFARAYTFTFEDISTVVRQTKKTHKGQAERIIIRTIQGRKIIVENSFTAYFKLVDKIQENVDASKRMGFEEE